MFGYELDQLFRKRRWRWLLVSLAIFVLALFMNQSTYAQFPPVTIWDFVVSGFTQHFSALIILPSLFLFLIVDLLIGDVNDGSVILTISRSKSRMSWLIAKIAVIPIAVLLFTLLCLSMYVLVGGIGGLSWVGALSERSVLGASVAPFDALSMIVGLFLLSLTAFATFIITITAYTRSVILPLVVGLILCLLSFLSFSRAMYAELFIWLPTSQMLLLAHIPNYAIEPREGFTLMWSYAYCLSLYVMSVLSCALRIRKMDFTTQE